VERRETDVAFAVADWDDSEGNDREEIDEFLGGGRGWFEGVIGWASMFLCDQEAV